MLSPWLCFSDPRALPSAHFSSIRSPILAPRQCTSRVELRPAPAHPHRYHRHNHLLFAQSSRVSSAAPRGAAQRAPMCKFYCTSDGPSTNLELVSASARIQTRGRSGRRTCARRVGGAGGGLCCGGAQRICVVFKRVWSQTNNATSAYSVQRAPHCRSTTVPLPRLLCPTRPPLYRTHKQGAPPSHVPAQQRKRTGQHNLPPMKAKGLLPLLCV